MKLSDLVSNGNAYKTKEICLKRAKYLDILNRVKNFTDYHNGDWKMVEGYYESLYIDDKNNVVVYHGVSAWPGICEILFKRNLNLAQKCIDKFGDELKLLFE